MKERLTKILKIIVHILNPINWLKGIVHFIKNFPTYFREFRHFTLELISFIFLFFVYLLSIGLTALLKLNFVPQILRNILLKLIYKISILVSKFDKKGSMKMNRLELFELAFKNMRFKKSRTIITVGGMAVGIGSIVFLVSLGYGLQKLVIDRVARLEEMKQIDVSVQPGSNVRMDERAIQAFTEIQNVSEVLPIIGVVSKVNYQGSVTDVAVYGTTTSYLENSAIRTVEGKLFESNNYKGPSGVNYFQNTNSPFNTSLSEAYTEYIDEDRKINGSGEVAGARDARISAGQKIQDVKFFIYPKAWLIVRESPKRNSKILGYTRRVEGLQYGEEVWGDPYIPARSDRVIVDSDGSAYGKWVESVFYMWELKDCSFSNPDCEEGRYLKKLEKEEVKTSPSSVKQERAAGFISEVDIAVEALSFDVNKDPENTHSTKEGSVLGATNELSETDASDDEMVKNYIYTIKDLGQAEVLGLDDLVDTTTTSETTSSAAAGSNIVDDEKWLELVLETSSSANKVETKKIPLPPDALKKAVVNDAFLKVLGLERKESIGKTFESYFVVTSNLLDSGEQKVESETGTYEIVGVVQGDTTPFFYVPIYDLYGMGVKYFSQIRVVCKSPEELPAIREKIESQGYETTSVVDTIAQINRLFTTARFVLALIGAVALAVASLGMFNTLTVSLLERTREVGLMKAMGMSSDEVRRLFLTESMMMGFAGGFVGMVIGFLAGKSVSLILTIFGIVNKVGVVDVSHIPSGFVLLIFILSLVVGIFTGIYPAKRATKISSLDALRYE